MSWFGFSDIAKNAISEAQKKIDKVLDIQQVEGEALTHKDQTASNDEGSSVSSYHHEINTEHTPADSHIIQVSGTSTRPIKTANFGAASFNKKNKKGNKLGTRLSPLSKKEKADDKTPFTGNVEDKFTTPTSNFSEQLLEVPGIDKNKDETLETNKNLSDMVLAEANEQESVTDKDIKTKGCTEKSALSANSTSDSSEIDVLDNESLTSEVSSIQSKLTDSEAQIQSPVSLVSSHINVLSDIELLPGSGYSSPPNASGDEVQLFNEKMTEYISNQSDNVNSLQVSNETPAKNQIEDVESHSDDNDETVNMAPVTTVENTNSLGKMSLEEMCAAETIEYKKQEDAINLLNEKIMSYEKKLFNLSNLNAKLCEDNDNFLSEIQMLKDNHYNESESQILELERSLFKMENKYNVVCEEKANLQKQKDIMEGNLASRMSNEQVQQVLSDKEESIRGLLEEGEKLSKQHLQQNNLIKKLKSQLTEKENTLKSTKLKYESVLKDKENLQTELEAVKYSDEEYKSTSMRISQAYKEKEDEIFLLKEKLAAIEEKETSLQNNLDSAYLNITELNKRLAEKESSLNSEWENKEHELKQQSDVEIRKLKMEFDHQKEIMLMQIMDLNNSIQKNEIVYGRKTDDLRLEIKDFQDRLQQAEIRNQELMEGVSNASAPLLRQLENLQTTSVTQQKSWMALEKNLNGRIEEAQIQLVLVQDKERVSQQNFMEFKTKFKFLEQQLSTEIENNKENKSLIDKLKAENNNLHENYCSSKKELEELHLRQSSIVEELKKEKLSLENQLNMEKVRSEADHKKFKTQQESWKKEREKLTWFNRNEVSSVSAPDVESLCSGKDSGNLVENSSFEHSLSFASSSFTASQSYNDIRMGSSTALENLQSQVKRNEGEIAQLHGEINRLERTRASMAEEIVRLTNENEDLETAVKELDDIKLKLAETETRYNTILGLYGEKEEENEELRMDLADVKSMYKQQINELLKPNP